MTASRENPPRVSSARSRPRVTVEWTLAGLALAAVVATWWGLLVIVDGGVVPLPLLAVVVAALVLVAQGRPARSAVRRLRVWTATLALVLGLLTVAGHVVVGTTYRLLPEASGRGCRVVAREDSFLMGGGGSLYTVRGESGVAHRVLSFATDDGERPFASGSADLRWRGEAATVTGPLWDASEHGPLAFSC